MREFIYGVNGKIFKDTVAFGIAWEKTVEEAKASNEMITRKVVNEKGQRIEFFAKGGVFLNIRYYEEKRVYKF